MKVQGELQVTESLLQRLNHAPYLRRMRHAGGVADRETAHTQVGEALRQPQHPVQWNVAFHRATKTGRQRHIDRCAPAIIALHMPDHTRQRRKAHFARHAQVGQVVGFRGGHHQVELVCLRLEGAFGTAQVRHQHGVFDAGTALYAPHHRLSVAQHRYRLG